MYRSLEQNLPRGVFPFACAFKDMFNMRHQQFSSTYHFVQTSIHIAVGAIKLLQTQLGADHSALLSKPLSNAGLLTWTVGGAPCWMRRTSSAQQSRKTVILSHVESPCTALHYMCSVKSMRFLQHSACHLSLCCVVLQRHLRSARVGCLEQASCYQSNSTRQDSRSSHPPAAWPCCGRRPR